MKERMNNIMSIVKDIKPLHFIDFSEAGESRFRIETACPRCLTFVNWEATAYLTIEVIHILGYLDVSEGVNPADLIRILEQNFDSDSGGGTFYGVFYQQDNDIFYVSQSANHIFLPKWSDEDIADVIATVFARIAGNILAPPKPIVQFDIELPVDWSQWSPK